MKKGLFTLLIITMMFSFLNTLTFAEETQRTIVVENTQDFMNIINNLPSNVIIQGSDDHTIIEMNQDYKLKLSDLDNVTFENLTFTNFKYISIDDSTHVTFSNVTFEDFKRTGLYLDNSDYVTVTDSTFRNFGSGDINITYQGQAIYAGNSDYLVITNNDISETYGLGSIFVTESLDFLIDNNEIYNTSLRAIQVYKNDSSGLISNNFIHDIGTLNTSGSGVGANGIFAEAESFDVDVINNTVINLLENGIEGKFGLVEGNYVEGTGMDLENFPTPSPEGIYANGRLYKNNTVKNTNGDAIKVYSGSLLDNITVIDNHVSQEDNGHNGIAFISKTGYSNILIENNTIDNFDHAIYVYKMPESGVVIGENLISNIQ